MNSFRTVGLALTLLASSTLLAGGAHAQTVTGAFVPTTGAQTVNLTTLGTTDWAQWGYGSTGSNFSDTTAYFNHKAGANLISNWNTAGTSDSVYGYGPSTDFPTFTWSNGATGGTNQVASGTTETGITNLNLGTQSGIGLGLGFTVSNLTAPGTLDVFVGGYAVNGTFTVTQGASTYTDTTFAAPLGVGDGEAGREYIVAFTGTTPLTVAFKATSGNPGGTPYRNIKLMGAALSLTPAAAPEPSSVAVLLMGALGLGGLGLRARRRSLAL